MIKVVLSGIYYPLAMLRYFERALERRDDVELITVGPYTASWIPWQGGMQMLPKYEKCPTCPFPKSTADIGATPYQLVMAQYGDVLSDIDLWIQVDAGWHVKFPENRDVTVAHVATDPHALNYDRQRKQSDYFFNMQTPYMKEGDIYLPYAYDPTVHYPMDIEKEYDACLIGLAYNKRVGLVNALKQLGYNVYFDIGHIFDEYREINNKSKIGLNWSSSLDMNARVWELAAMGICAVENTVPDMPTFFTENEHYLPFSTKAEAIEQVTKALNDTDMRKEIADNAFRKVQGQTYDARVEQILKTCKKI